MLRVLGGQPLDEVDLGADGECRRFGRLGDGLRDVRGRPGLIGGGHGLARAFGVDDDADIRVLVPSLVDLGGSEALVHGAEALPEDDAGVR